MGYQRWNAINDSLREILNPQLSLDRGLAQALAVAQPYIQRNRVDEATLRGCAAFGPSEVLAARIEEYVKGGCSKFILRPLCPSDRMLDQLGLASEHVIPEYHRRQQAAEKAYLLRWRRRPHAQRTESTPRVRINPALVSRRPTREAARAESARRSACAVLKASVPRMARGIR